MFAFSFCFVPVDKLGNGMAVLSLSGFMLLCLLINAMFLLNGSQLTGLRESKNELLRTGTHRVEEQSVRLHEIECIYYLECASDLTWADFMTLRQALEQLVFRRWWFCA